MSNITPLGSGARSTFINITPPAAPEADASESPSTQPSPATTAPTGDGSSASATAGTDTTTIEPTFDVSEFHDAFAALKQQVTDRRATLTMDVAGLQSEDEQLQASIADWDARANAAEDRRTAIKDQLNTKLGEFAQLDEATTHLEATEALLYPAATPAVAPDASAAPAEAHA